MIKFLKRITPTIFLYFGYERLVLSMVSVLSNVNFYRDINRLFWLIVWFFILILIWVLPLTIVAKSLKKGRKWAAFSGLFISAIVIFAALSPVEGSLVGIYNFFILFLAIIAIFGCLSQLAEKTPRNS